MPSDKKIRGTIALKIPPYKVQWGQCLEDLRALDERGVLVRPDRLRVLLGLRALTNRLRALTNRLRALTERTENASAELLSARGILPRTAVERIWHRQSRPDSGFDLEWGQSRPDSGFDLEWGLYLEGHRALDERGVVMLWALAARAQRATWKREARAVLSTSVGLSEGHLCCHGEGGLL
jgi:hypothetical protein